MSDYLVTSTNNIMTASTNNYDNIKMLLATNSSEINYFTQGHNRLNKIKPRAHRSMVNSIIVLGINEMSQKLKERGMCNALPGCVCRTSFNTEKLVTLRSINKLGWVMIR